MFIYDTLLLRFASSTFLYSLFFEFKYSTGGIFIYPFKAYQFENSIVIGKTCHYNQGELLTAYLNTDFSNLHKRYLECLELKTSILYPVGGGDNSYDTVVHKVQGFFTYMDMLIQTLPPYHEILRPEEIKLDSLYWLLSDYPILFKTKEDMEIDSADDEYHFEPTDEEVEDYNLGGTGILGDTDSYKAQQLQNKIDHYFEDKGEQVRSTFYPKYFDDDFEEFIEDLNNEIETLYNTYMSLAEDILRVPFLYGNLLDNYIHACTSIADQGQIAEAYQRFLEDNIKQSQQRHLYTYEKMTGANNLTVTHEVLPIVENGEKSTFKIWAITEYPSIGAFLYMELFGGIQSGHLPKRCQSCGKYFLLTSGYNADFCENIAPNETTKTCRDIGARKRYDDKVKNDPIWLAYQRAYKAHYARVSKKKMTKPEFLIWSEYAIELRAKMLAGELEFEEYVRLLKK